MTRFAPAATAVLLACAVTLVGCTSTKGPSAEEWLADQPFVLEVEVAETTADDLATTPIEYPSLLRAELDPLATADDIEKLISDTIRQVQPDNEAGVQFAMLGLAFDVTTRSETADAFALWRDIDDVPGIERALVLSDFISASTPRESAVAVFDELAALGVGVRVDGDQPDVDAPIAIVRPLDCEPPAGARELAASETANAAVRYATYDLCEGFDVVYANGTVLDATIGGVFGALDAAGLGAFPVRVSVAPPTASSPDFHTVELTPGAREAIGVVTALDASGVAMRYELFAPTSEGQERELTIETTGATLKQLHALLAASPAAPFLGKLTLTASDGEFEGHLEGLAEELAPAPSTSPSPTPSP